MTLIYIKYLKGQYFFNPIFIFVMVFTQPVIADQASYEFGVALMSFDYAEYRENNAFLDGETGFIPGIIVNRKQHHEGIYSELVGQLYGNTIDYDGQTQSDIPLTTKSDAVIFDTHFKLGIHLSEVENHGVYAGLGYRYWLRNIRSGYDINGNSVAGLFEEYYWFYGILGYTASYVVSENVNVGFDIRYTQMINAKMDINFLGYCDYDNTQVNLGNESGVRFAVPIKIKNRKHTFTVAPYYEMIDIGKSNIIALTRNGSLVDCDLNGFNDAVFEPRSETRNVGVEVTWLW